MMKPTREELNELARKWLSGTITPEEKMLLDEWYDYDSDTPVQRTKNEAEEELQGERLLANIHERKVKVIPMRRKWQIPAAAAAILIMVGTVSYFYFRSPLPKQEQSFVQNQIKPGGNKAILTLGNGKRIILTGAANGTLAKQSGVQIIKLANGQISYTISDVTNHISAVEYNTIETPKGGQYQVHLPDGTDVWLNAASTLKYPTSFTAANTRTVELTGEAYFQVAKDKTHPFTVKTAKEEITVLGTHFNVNTYNDEPVEKTTLLEGSVKVTAGKVSKLIVPGQNAIVSNGVLTVAKANIEEAVAWKNGYFRFNGESLESVMRKLTRWYDIDVQYDSTSSEVFYGKVSRFTKIEDVLSIMEGTKGVHFKIEGKEGYRYKVSIPNIAVIQ